jgi:hypothetical protein
MNIRYFLLIPFLLLNSFAQQNYYEYAPFSIRFEQGVMEVKNGDAVLYTHSFRNPSENGVDLDGDGIDEFLVIDQMEEDGRRQFILFIFNITESFFLVDSISSGSIEPYIIYSEEVEDYILISGNSSFMQFTGNNAEHLPVNCYKYETGEVFLVNDEIYDVFISENDELLEIIDKYFEMNARNCTSSLDIIPALSAAYANYINAGEPTLASHLITNYYYCDDKERFIKKIDDLIQN